MSHLCGEQLWAHQLPSDFFKPKGRAQGISPGPRLFPKAKERAQRFSPRPREFFPVQGAIAENSPRAQGRFPVRGGYAENSPEARGNFPASREVSKGSASFDSTIAEHLVSFIPQSPEEGRNLPSCQIIRLSGGGPQDEPSSTLQSRGALVPEPFSFLKSRPRLTENSNKGSH